VLHHISGGADTSDINYTSVGIPANNPFWDEETDRVDFKKYVKKLGVPRIDICFILLGWNSVSEDENIYKAQVRKFLDTLRHDMPDCRVILMGLQMPASQDGIGRDYGASNSFMELAANTKKINKCYTDICREYEGVSFTDIAGQFDIDNGYPPFERKISERFEVIETVPSNAVHPGMDGYMQIGDAAFRELNAILVNEYNKD